MAFESFLRGIAGLNPQNTQMLNQQVQFQQQQSFLKNQMLAKAIFEGVQNGTIPPQEGSSALQKLGYDVPQMQATPQQTGKLGVQVIPGLHGYVTVERGSGNTSPTMLNGERVMPPQYDIGRQAGIASGRAQGTIQGKNIANAPQAAGTVINAMNPLDRMVKTVDELTTSPGLSNITGFIEGRIPNLSQSARNAQAKLDTLKSQIAQNVLQMYRNMSQTGGAVGQTSDYEQKMFMNNLASLDTSQSTQEFKAQLNNIKAFVKGSKQRMLNAYRLQFGDKYLDVIKQMNASDIQNQNNAKNASPQPPKGMVLMQDDQGNQYHIPSANQQKAIQRGLKLVQ